MQNHILANHALLVQIRNRIKKNTHTICKRYCQILYLCFFASIILSSQICASAIAQTNKQDILRIVDVESRSLNCLFDSNCSITVNDQVSKFLLQNGAGEGILQSRVFPIGEKGTPGAGYTAYLYRIDLTEIKNTSQTHCLQKFSLDFPDRVSMLYNREKEISGDIFVVTRNAIGTIKPRRAWQAGRFVHFEFDNLCIGANSATPDKISSFFFGMAATSAPKSQSAIITTTTLPITDNADGIALKINTRGSGAKINVRARDGDGGATTNQVSGNATSKPVGPVVLSQTKPTNDQPRTDNLLDFENIKGQTGGPGDFQAGIVLDRQYLENYSIRFNRGVSVHRCSQGNEFSPCTYPRAASGVAAALYNGRANRGKMVLDFTRPVKTLTMRVNPTGGVQNQQFTLRLIGFNQDGEITAQKQTQFIWDADQSLAWPVTASLTSNPQGQIMRITAELLSRSDNGRSVRFLFDDLGLSFKNQALDLSDSKDENSANVGPAILAGTTVTAPLGQAQLIPRPPDTNKTKRIFKPAPRYLASIDWEAAERALEQQRRNGLEPAPVSDDRDFNRATLPLLLPKDSDTPVDVAATRDGHSYSAAFAYQGYHYEYFGTRIITRYNGRTSHRGAQNQETPPPVQYVESETSFAASFSAYGAAYRLIRYCKNDSPRIDPLCFDRSTMEEQIRNIMIGLGQKAGERP